MTPPLGRKIRELRQAKGWTLAQLSGRSGVALSTLSRIETGSMTGTLESHLAISRAFGIRLSELYADLDPGGSSVELWEARRQKPKVLLGKEQGVLVLTKGPLGKKMLPLLIPLKGGKEFSPEPAKVGVEKFLYLLKGRVEVTIGQRKILLGEEDGVYFQASLPHRLKNLSAKPALILGVSAPPTL